MPEQFTPFVSIVMCVYNGEKYLHDQLDSVLNQTYSNFELLILDDRSTDASFSILSEFELKHGNIRLIHNRENLGFNKNFEKGILQSKGDLIAICDQDDIWLPGKIEELVANIGDAMLIYSNSELIDEQGKSLNRTLAYKLVHVDNPCFKAFLESNFITGHTCLFKRELINYILPFSDKTTYYDQWIGMVASYVGQVKYYDKVLTQYRVHSDSVIQQNKHTKECKYFQKQKMRNDIMLFAGKDFVTPDDRSFIEEFLQKKMNTNKGVRHYIGCYLFLLKNHTSIYPWYAKPFIKKLNFLRNQCL